MMNLPVIENVPAKRLCTCYLKGDAPRVCSHVAAQKTKKGQPLFTSKALLEKAATLKGFKIVETNQYSWYNRHVGDYPVPEGMNVADLGKNAMFILRMDEPLRSEMIKKKGREPYDIGVIADPNNEGCFTLIYDFWSGGYGIDETLGAPARDKGVIQMLCPELKQTYDMVCESQAAQEAGDNIEFLTLQQARLKYPQLLTEVPIQPDDHKTWVSFANTENRVGVS